MSKKYVLDFEKYADCARRVVAEGQVLLKNDNQVLPLKKDTTVALFGRIQTHYYKSGTGSGGMVNVNRVIGLPEAIRESKSIHLYEPLFDVYAAWEKENPFDEGVGWGNEPWSQKEMPLSEEVVTDAAKNAEVALVVIGRTAGEEQDNRPLPGSWFFTDEEMAMLSIVRAKFAKMVVLLNVSNILDMNWSKEIHPDGILYIWQGGMIGGLGTVDILTGKENPSGKLPDTIAYDLKDYPSDPYFGNKVKNYYKEDIYVGYRYFETFAQDKVWYPFGFGLSYTTFDVKGEGITFNGESLKLQVAVKNTGLVAGREVAQVYVKAPLGLLGKASKVLVGFRKTDLLSSNEVQLLSFDIPVSYLASFDETGKVCGKTGWVLEKGVYEVYAGNNVRDCEVAGSFELKEALLVEALESALAPNEPFERMKNENGEMIFEAVPQREKSPYEKREERLPEALEITGDKGYKLWDVKAGKVSMEEFIAQFSVEELCIICRGEGMGSPQVTPGTAAAFGGVSESLKNYGIPCACCDDGPSGMRLDSGMKAFSLPNGVNVASTFHPELIEELYAFTAIEMIKNRVDVLLGPGMNIHRHPLNGRNFEYFSEDPLLTGKMASAIVKGLHRYGQGGSLKHFCANSQETARHDTNNVVSERALREIYLKGYELAVKEAQADTVMTTYGPVNGIWTAGSYDLDTVILRDQWGFKGIAMTDWWAKTNQEGEDGNKWDFATMVRAQNDLYMVCQKSVDNEAGDNLLESAKDGSLTIGELQRSAMNICNYLFHTHVYDRVVGEVAEVEVIGGEEGYEESSKEITYYKGSKDTVIDLSHLEAKKGESFDFALELDEIGTYEVEVTASSDLGELAQIPVSFFFQSVLFGVYTFNGTNGKDDIRTSELDMYTRYPVMRLYFGANGLKVKQIRFRYLHPLE